jgi:hypothetical protein
MAAPRAIDELILAANDRPSNPDNRIRDRNRRRLIQTASPGRATSSVWRVTNCRPIRENWDKNQDA